MGLPRNHAPTMTEILPGAPGGCDAALVARAREGDPRAFALLYRGHVERVYAYAARRLASRAAAEEATQEIFTRALAGIGRCRSDDAFAGWLFAIARHVVQEQWRASGRVIADDSQRFDAEDPDPTPEEQAVRQENARELREAREHCLNVREQELFDLLLADLTDAEIAVALGRRAGAVRTAHWRLLTNLRDCVGVSLTNGGGNVAR